MKARGMIAWMGLPSTSKNWRQQFFYQIHEIYLTELPFIVLFGSPDIAMLRKGTHNYQPHPWRHHQHLAVVVRPREVLGVPIGPRGKRERCNADGAETPRQEECLHPCLFG